MFHHKLRQLVVLMPVSPLRCHYQVSLSGVTIRCHYQVSLHHSDVGVQPAPVWVAVEDYRPVGSQSRTEANAHHCIF